MKRIITIFLICALSQGQAQNVGIGTTTPQSRLHISSPADEALRLEANQPYVSLYSNGVYKGYLWKSPNSIEVGSAAGSNLPVTIAPDGVQRMIVNAQGNVGIGTTTPSQKLDVDGIIRMRQGNPGSGKILTSDADGNASWTSLSAAGSGGGVGFGSWGDCSMNSISEYNPVVDPSGNNGDQFGFSVSISGNYAIVGAHRDDGPLGIDQGSASFFQFDGTNWVLMQKITDATGAGGDRFGFSVSISGNYAIVGAHFDDAATGSASIYQFNGTNWVLMQKINDADGVANDYFGLSVSISGNYAIVGSPFDDGAAGTDQGSACVYQFNGTNWVLMQKITDATGAAGDQFGYSVSISGNYTVVGAPYDDVITADIGSAGFYQFNGTNWVLMQKVFVGSTSDMFGTSVSVSGNYAIIGVPGDNGAGGADQGSAVIYLFNGSNWLLMKQISDPTGAANDLFGYSVYISGNYAIIGAHLDDGSAGTEQGSASIYLRVGNGWQKLQHVTDPGANMDDQFGFLTAIDGITKRFLIGAFKYANESGKTVFGKIN